MSYLGFRSTRRGRGVTRRGRGVALAGQVLLVGALLAAPTTWAALRANAAPSGPQAPVAGPGLRPACPPVAPGRMRCFALYRPQYAVNRAIAAGATSRSARPSGRPPRQIESAYRLPVVKRDSHQTVAVSIAFSTPDLWAYLAHYRAFFGLPPCTMASGCLRIVNQEGKALAAAPLWPAHRLGPGRSPRWTCR